MLSRKVLQSCTHTPALCPHGCPFLGQGSHSPATESVGCLCHLSPFLESNTQPSLSSPWPVGGQPPREDGPKRQFTIQSPHLRRPHVDLTPNHSLAQPDHSFLWPASFPPVNTPQHIVGIQIPILGCVSREPSLSHLTSRQECSAWQENLASGFPRSTCDPKLSVRLLSSSLPIEARCVPTTTLDISGAFVVIHGFKSYRTMGTPEGVRILLSKTLSAAHDQPAGGRRT